MDEEYIPAILVIISIGLSIIVVSFYHCYRLKTDEPLVIAGENSQEIQLI